MKNYKCINVKNETHDQIKFIADCLDRSIVSVLSEISSEIFQLFSSYNPKNKDARIFYDSHSGKLVITTVGKSNIIFGHFEGDTTESDESVDKKIKTRLEKQIKERE